MKPEDFLAEKVYQPVDRAAIEGDLDEILYDHICDYFEPIRLNGEDWELADHEAYIHPQEDCDRACETELIIRRKSDGYMFSVEISVSVTRYLPEDLQA